MFTHIKKDSPLITTGKVLKVIVLYYIFKIGIWFTKLAYSWSIASFVIGMLSETANDFMVIYIPLCIFIFGSILATIGEYYTLDGGIEIINKLRINNESRR